MLYLHFADEVPSSAGGLVWPDVEASAISAENTATLTQATDTRVQWVVIHGVEMLGGWYTTNRHGEILLRIYHNNHFKSIIEINEL